MFDLPFDPVLRRADENTVSALQCRWRRTPRRQIPEDEIRVVGGVCFVDVVDGHIGRRIPRIAGAGPVSRSVDHQRWTLGSRETR